MGKRKKRQEERPLKEVLIDLLERMAADPEEDEWNEWARKLLAQARVEASEQTMATARQDPDSLLSQFDRMVPKDSGDQPATAQ